MPSTPLGLTDDGDGAAGGGDTERPPSLTDQDVLLGRAAPDPFPRNGAEPESGIAPLHSATPTTPGTSAWSGATPTPPATTADGGATGDVTRIGPPPASRVPLRAATPRPGGPSAPSSNRLAAARPAAPSSPALGRPPAPSSPALGRPPAPSSPGIPPTSAPIMRAATMIGGAAPARPSPGSAPGRAAAPARTSAGMPRATPRPTPAAAFAPAGPPAETSVDAHAERAAGGGTLTFGLGEGTAIENVPLTRRCSACNELYPEDFLVCPRDASPLVDESGGDEDPLLGKLLGETYQIVRVVGEGGMGRIYEARHLRLKERRFAVKMLHADLARNQEMAARFLREAESASSLDHPNVVDVFDVHHLADGTPYFVGEFLDGEELAALVERRGPLEPRAAVGVARQVCGALVAAHARGIVHRDMKPENIFVLRDSLLAFETGEAAGLAVKVLDFGISKAGGGERTHLTKTGVIMGTPSYMAPEQARGKQVDHRADVYGVGAVLYFALTGRRPFDSDDPTSTLSMVLTQDPVRPREIDPRIPESLELIVQRAMAKDPRDRHQTMAELEKALATYEDGVRVRTPAVPITGIDPLIHAHAQSAMDVARILLGTHSVPPPAATPPFVAKAARPTIVLASVVLAVWLVGGTAAALAGLVRVLHDGEITLTECVLLVVGCLFAAATPAALYVMHVRKVVWPNSVRAVQLATDLKRAATAALVTYGAIAILARIGHTVLFRSSKGLVSGFWDILLLVASLAAAATIGGLRPLLANVRRRRSS